MTLSTLSGSSNFPLGGSLQTTQYPWLHSRTWDLIFIVSSVVVSLIPYTAFWLFGGDDVARQVVNGLVTLLVGGPHLYATFNRTLLDTDFRRRHRLFLASSLLIPITVTILIVTHYVAMLTAFFLMASLHALQQITFLNDGYVKKSGITVSPLAKWIDFGVVFLSLYPWATYKMMRGEFYIGPVQLWSPFNPGEFLHGQEWMVYSIFAAFYLFLAAFVIKSVQEWRQGTLNVPKTLLILVTLPLMYFTPLIDNLDTAFQGINVWHSFQYLAITWLILRRDEGRWEQPRNALFVQFRASFSTLINWLRTKVRGETLPITPEQSTLLWTAAFYSFQLLMLPISGLMFIFAHVMFPNLPYAEQYSYLMVLPILLVHYYHDAFLFTQPETLVEQGMGD